MWNDDLKVGELTLDMELTTFCNAKCPQCSRTDEVNNLNKKSWLPLQQVSISKFKSWFPPGDICYIANFHFSGTYGDPGMCKDLYKIVEYIINNSHKTTISINTNGGMRDEQFWFNLGAKGQKRLKVIFDVDGIDQEMHSFYRRNVKLSTVLENMTSVLQTPAKVEVLTVLFRHNQEYLEQIEDMCRKLGVERFDSVEGNNFRDGPVYKFNDEDGNEQQLLQITRQDREQGLERLDRRVRDHRHISDEYIKISCLAEEQKTLKVHATGLVAPCCYLSTPLETAAIHKPNENPSRHITTIGKDGSEINPLMKEYVDNHHMFTLGNRSIKDIVNDPWFNGKLKDSWKQKETAAWGCKKVCGKGCAK